MMTILGLGSYSISDFISFSDEVYFRFFVRQLEACWPLLILSSIAGIAIPVLAGMSKTKAAAIALAISFAISAITFHFKYFAELSPIGTVFGWAFLIQVPLLLAWGCLETSRQPFRPSVHAITGLAISAFGLVLYPLLTRSEEWGWKGAAYFGMAPDPTVCLCYGLALMAARPLWTLMLLPIPLVWTFVSWGTLDTFEAKTALILPVLALITIAAIIWKAIRTKAEKDIEA